MSKIQSFGSFNEENNNENNGEANYMFFSNLETIKRLTDKLLEMDRAEIDAMLNEHDWASDHITSSKDDIEEVFNFISGRNKE